MQSQLPPPTASGSFAKTPFPHLVVYALERRLSGTFELRQGMAPRATMLVVSGCPAKVRLAQPGLSLGEVMSELGMVAPEHLHASLAQMGQGRLHGQILLEMGAISPEALDAGLRAQVERKVEALFTLGGDTTFDYFDGVDLLQHVGGPPTPIDPFPVLWRGVREAPAWEHVDATLRRIGTAHLRASQLSQLERFAWSRQELDVVEMLRQRPLRLVDVTNMLGATLGQTLAYFLLIMKQVELVDPAQMPVAPAPRAQAQASMQGPPSGQAFARVELKRQTHRTAPVIVVEEVAPSAADDERASSPGMASPPASAFGRSPTSQPFPVPSSPPPPEAAAPFSVAPPPSSSSVPVPPPEPVISEAPPAAPGGAFDIGSMITQTIRSSMPPAAPESAPMPAITGPGAPPVVADAAGPPPSSSRMLTAEQNALKTKILERAEQITSQDYFQMLGLDRAATPEQVQKAFFGLAKVWHPDRLPPALIDVKDACSKVFTHLTEAHATLMDPTKRQDYMLLLRDGGATPEDQAKIQAILEAATEFQKAEFLLKRNMGDPQAYEIVRRCVSLDPEQADYMATLAWLDAQKPEWLSREKTLEKTLLLDRCIHRNPNCERAYFYRGLLYKRAEEGSKALKDFKKAAELNPRNLDAMREVRLFAMRGGVSKPPPPTPGAAAASAEKLGGLFGKLFKK